MTMMAKQIGANRIVTGIRIPHPCGVPDLPEEQDRAIRREIVKCALKALQTGVETSTVFNPDIKYSAV
jgi:glycine reductase complex component B subunit gamma